ncbi:MAG TPA: HU family DNA-binding protein [Tepidisphaeraceae bacterium]|nr:HU family DNA-binding protein [Tepidisphaeraceae bacterium]
MAKTATAGPKPLTKSEIAGQLAETVGITKKQAIHFLQAQAELAYAQAKNQFVIPGLGKLKVRDSAARTGRNPKTGEPIQIKASKKLKFYVSKAAKDAILGAKE